MGSFCPCGSKINYKVCCESMHNGKNANTPIELVRSRYSAYYLNILGYIIDTTHPLSPRYIFDKKRWKENLNEFLKKTKFIKLNILDFQEKEDKAFVIFSVEFLDDKNKNFFIERSFFEKIQDKWFYKKGNYFSKYQKNPFLKKDLSDILKIAYYKNPIFKKEKEDISVINDDLKNFIEKMKITCDVYCGVGLAACQVHSEKNLFIKIKDNVYEAYINPKIISFENDCLHHQILNCQSYK